MTASRKPRVGEVYRDAAGRRLRILHVALEPTPDGRDVRGVVSAPTVKMPATADGEPTSSPQTDRGPASYATSFGQFEATWGGVPV